MHLIISVFIFLGFYYLWVYINRPREKTQREKLAEKLNVILDTPCKSSPLPIIKLSRVCNQFMTAIEKSKYLHSKDWQSVKLKVQQRDGNKCVICGNTPVEVHHITYVRLGDEKLEDLVCLCRKHHQQIHDRLGYDRVTIYNV